MNTKAKFSFGMVALVAASMIGFVPASADKGNPLASVTVTMIAVVENAAETPQDLVWDMTYGPDRPMAVEEAVEIAADDGAVVDYTFG
jgi:hypothetical protein